MSEWIISSAVLIGAVCIGRAILKGKIGLCFQYALWAIVLIRLLVPFNFTESAISILNFAEKNQVKQSTEQIYIPMPEQDYERAYTQVVETYHEKGIQTSQVDKNVLQNEVTEKMHPKISLKEVLFTVWVAGMILMGISLLVANLRFFMRLSRTRRKIEVENCPVPVYITKVVENPCLFGVFRPSIYLTPEVAENQTTREHVLAHEMTHYYHFDHVWSALRGVCLLLHWYNPLVWIASKLSRQDGELACDEGTLKRIGEERRADYGRTLIALTNPEPFGNVLVSATTMVGGKKAMKERITLLMKKPKSKTVTVAVVLLAVTFLAGCTFTKSQSVENKTQLARTPVTKEDAVVMTGTETAEIREEEMPTEATSQEGMMAEATSQEEISEKETSAGEMSAEELKEMVDLFYRTPEQAMSEEIPWYLLALTSYYRTPEELNLFEFFQCGTRPTSIDDLSEAEIEFLLKDFLGGIEGGREDLINVTRSVPSEMDEILVKYFGMPFSEANLQTGLKMYCEETGSYLQRYRDANLCDIEITNGYRLENGDVAIYYNYIRDINERAVVTMYQHEGEWRIKSNLPINHDGTVADVSFRHLYAYLSLGPFDSIGYQGDIYYCSIDGVITAVRRSDGEVLWENDNVGANYVASMIGTDGTLYLLGDYGLNFAAVDKDDHLLAKTEEFVPGYPYGVSMKYGDNYIEVTVASEYGVWFEDYEGETSGKTAVFRVNLDDYSYEIVE